MKRLGNALLLLLIGIITILGYGVIAGFIGGTAIDVCGRTMQFWEWVWESKPEVP